MTRLLLVLGVLCAVPPTAQAQIVFDPTTLVFTASSDHEALVASYELWVYAQGGALLADYNLGKPTPSASGEIRLVNPAWFLTQIGLVCEARVAAIGADGQEGVSEVSNPWKSTGGPPIMGVVSLVIH